MRNIADRFCHWLDNDAHRLVIRLLTMMVILVLGSLLFLLGALSVTIVLETFSKL